MILDWKEAQEQFFDLLDEVAKGRSFTISMEGEQIARLRPADSGDEETTKASPDSD